MSTELIDAETGATLTIDGVWTLAECCQLSPHRSSREGQGISLIVVHQTGSKNPIETTMDWFANPNSKVSSHFVISRDGIIGQCVFTQWAAWHAGKSSFLGATGCNLFSIGIELCNDGKEPFPEAQLTALEKLIADLRAGFGDLPLVGHREICMPSTRKPTDPHDGFPVGRFRPAHPVWDRFTGPNDWDYRKIVLSEPESISVEQPAGAFSTAERQRMRNDLQERKAQRFEEELTALINSCSQENGSNTPDFILAQYVRGCLAAYNEAVKRRDNWYDIKPAPGWKGPQS